MELIDWIFAQYSEYTTITIVLELVAVAASVVSVLYSKRNSVLVFPYGILSTILFVYLLYRWNLLGDMVINAYYFIMSVYGWYIWTKRDQAGRSTTITVTTTPEWWISLFIFITTGATIYVLYSLTDRMENWVSYVDMTTTGTFFAGMWLMARRKLEHWLVLLVGNVVSIPLYFYKGAAFTALLYIFLAIIAYIGFIQWKKYHLKPFLQASE